MPQWGSVFYENGKCIAPLVGTQVFEAIKLDSLVEDLVLLDGVGDMDSLRTKYIGMTYNEFEQTANINNKVSG